MVAFEPGLVADLPPGRGRPPQPGEVALPLERWERPHRGHRLEPHRHHLGQPHAHLAPVEADEPDLELNWGRIGHVTRKRMKHPCNPTGQHHPDPGQHAGQEVRIWPTSSGSDSPAPYLRDHTAQRPTYAETQKTARRGQAEPVRDVLRRQVRTAAAGATTIPEFLERLRRDGVLVHERHSERNPGEITDYAVASADSVDAAGKPVYYGGGRLAAAVVDLSLIHI